MKKLLLIILSMALMLTLLTGIMTVSADDITVELDGNIIDFDVDPEIIDGRTMVPLRKIFEEIGALVKWDNDTQTVSARKNKKTITLTINSADLQIDKGDTDEEGNPIVETVILEVPAQIVQDRTLVPVRVISESFGLNVDWDEDEQKVIITSEDDGDDSWKENVGSINLTDLRFEGNGIEISDNQIKITAGGDFTVTGTLDEGNITISTKEKVKLRLTGASITSSENPCIFVQDADKAYITLTDGTENYLVANSDDGAIYSKENLEIKGDGTLNIESSSGHAIKASDNLTIENGTLNLIASGDGIHINDTFKMTGGIVNITAVGDGIDSESIVNISGGTIDIETNGVPIETTTSTADATTDEIAENNMRRGWMQQETADLEFEKSSKGINAEWMMCISGGEITVNAASHAIHCQDEMEITGGELRISSKYEKGISAHGNLTISNSDTVIDVAKSTEGIESKNVMKINDGVITVASTDDALNATGGNSGAMPLMGQGGGMRENMGKMPRPENPTDATGKEIPEMPPMPENGEFPMRGERPAMPEGQTGNVDIQQRPQMDGNAGMPGGNMGGMGRNMKDCLIINGGVIELYAGDDCLDANGNLVINGGTIKATKSNGSFFGANGIIDPDGQTTISEDAELLLASGSGNERSLRLSQNNIILYCDSAHNAEEQITVKDSSGNTIYDYTPIGSYRAVLIASKNLEIGEKYTITVGSETHMIILEEQSAVVGTQKIGATERNRFMQ